MPENNDLLIPFEIKNYLEDMRSKVTFAFEDADVFDRYLRLLVGPTLELQEVVRQLMQERSIDTAVGEQLDIIGRIVGQDRELLEAEILEYFGFENAPGAEPYGSLDDSTLGGIYWDLTKPQGGNVVLTDDQYRLFIKGKILKNLTRATPEDVIGFIKYVFNITRVQITSDEYGQAIILVSDDVDNFTLSMLRYFLQKEGWKSYFIPKSLGVGYQIGTFTLGSFGYAGVPGVEGYGTLIDDVIVGGGRYATLQ